MIDPLAKEALRILEGRGAILDVAREVSDVLRTERIEGAIIGGVAVVLHGYVRTTVDVDVYTPDPAVLGEALTRKGFTFDPERREYLRSGVPVHLVSADHVWTAPTAFEDRDGIATIPLRELVNMKLRSGVSDPLRAQDLGDVIGLIGSNRLTAEFASKIDKDLRAEFRKLAAEIEQRKK